MTEQVKENAVRYSKYAAKRFANATADQVSTNAEEGVSHHVSEASPRPFIKDKKKFGLPPVIEKFPEHVVRIALLIKNNAEIRRFTALGILNYLLQKGEIQGDNRYVSFKWNKFAVKSNGLMREYSYNEPFFLNCLVASFSSFSASAQRTIDTFCKKEMSVSIGKAVDQEEVNNITALNEQYQDAGEDIKVEAE